MAPTNRQRKENNDCEGRVMQVVEGVDIKPLSTLSHIYSTLTTQPQPPTTHIHTATFLWQNNRLVLLITFSHACQLWDCSHPTAALKELYFSGEAEQRVLCVSLLASPSTSAGREDEFAEVRPLIATAFEGGSVQFRGLTGSTDLVKEIHTGEVTEMASNAAFIVLATKEPYQLQIYSNHTLTQLAVLNDTIPEQDRIPFTLGSKFLAYACSTPVRPSKKSSDDVYMGMHSKSYFQDCNGKDELGKVAGKVAVDLVDGVKVISSLTQTAISNYFSPPHQEFIAPPSSPPRSPQYTSQQLGTIIIRSLSSSSSPAPLTNSLSSPPSSLHYQQTLNKTYPIVSHFKPHTSPINILTFNPAGDLLVSSDTGGNTVYVWRINDPVICLHKLQVGYTPRKISRISISPDSGYVSVTSPSTTHIFRISPHSPLTAPVLDFRKNQQQIGKCSNPIARIKKPVLELTFLLMSATSINDGFMRWDDGFIKRNNSVSSGDVCVQKVLTLDMDGGVVLSEIKTSYSEEKKGTSSPNRSPIEGWWGVGGYRSVCVDLLKFDLKSGGGGEGVFIDGFFEEIPQEQTKPWISQIELSTHSTTTTHLLWLRPGFKFQYFIHNESPLPKKKKELVFSPFGEPDYSDLPETEDLIITSDIPSPYSELGKSPPSASVPFLRPRDMEGLGDDDGYYKTGVFKEVLDKQGVEISFEDAFHIEIEDEEEGVVGKEEEYKSDSGWKKYLGIGGRNQQQQELQKHDIQENEQVEDTPLSSPEQVEDIGDTSEQVDDTSLSSPEQIEDVDTFPEQVENIDNISPEQTENIDDPSFSSPESMEKQVSVDTTFSSPEPIDFLPDKKLEDDELLSSPEVGKPVKMTKRTKKKLNRKSKQG